MQKSPYVDEEFSLWAMLSQTRNAVYKARQKELVRNNVFIRHSVVLLAVQAIEDNGDKATPAKLSRRLFLEPHSVSELLGRMEKLQLVRKVKDLEKRNQVRVEITEKGLEICRRSTKRESIHRMMSTLTKEEKKQLWTSLHKILKEALKELGRHNKIPFPFYEK